MRAALWLGARSGGTQGSLQCCLLVVSALPHCAQCCLLIKPLLVQTVRTSVQHRGWRQRAPAKCCASRPGGRPAGRLPTSNQQPSGVPSLMPDPGPPTKPPTWPHFSRQGCGIVEFESPEEAAAAIQTLNHTELDGRQIFVREDREVGLGDVLEQMI